MESPQPTQAAPHDASTAARKGHTIVLVFYLIGLVLLIAAAVVPLVLLDLKYWFWAMTLMGAAVISALASAAALPTLRERRHQGSV